MYIETVKNRKSPPAILLRESFRDGNKIKKKTLANLTALPSRAIELLKLELKNPSDGKSVVAAEDLFTEVSSVAIGHVKACLHAFKASGLEKIVAPGNSKNEKIITILIITRLLGLQSKLSTSNALLEGSGMSAILELLDLKSITADDCYSAMDWLYERQDRIQQKLANKHLKNDCAVLTDLSSSYYYGESCPLAQYGYSRDKKKGLPQINYSLMCSEDGTPVGIKVFPGNTIDSKAFPEVLKDALEYCEEKEITVVGDRGTITGKGIGEHLRKNKNLHWITALKHASIKCLLENSHIQLSLFGEDNIFDLTDIKGYKGEKLVVCRNEELARKTNAVRDELIELTKGLLIKYQDSLTKKKKPIKPESIPLKVGKLIDKKKMSKYFDLNFSATNFTWAIKEEKLSIDKEISGIYVLRTDKIKMENKKVVRTYKQLCDVEKDFRAFKSTEINIRPIFHYTEERVKTHIFICMLTCYVERYMKVCWTDLTFRDTESDKSNPLKFIRTEDAIKKENTKENSKGENVMAFRDILKNLAGVHKVTFEYNKIAIVKYTYKSELQRKALELIGLNNFLYPAKTTQ